MILPTKHVKLSNSLINVGAIILNNLNTESTVSLLWDKMRTIPEIKTFERFILGLDMLYIFDLIEFRQGLIMRLR